jgi:hypothetical protein
MRLAKICSRAAAGMLMAASGMLVACNPLQLDSSGKARPATEETVTGTWRNAEPGSDGTTVRMTLRIDADHSMVWARRISGLTGDGTDREYRRENWTWSIEDGILKAVKTLCEYADDPAGELLSAQDCRPPLEYDIPIKVNGNAWTIREEDRVMLFRKD